MVDNRLNEDTEQQPACTWEDVVDTLRFDMQINTKQLSREIGRTVAVLKTGPDPRNSAEHLVNLLLLRLAMKEAFSPDTDQRHEELILPYYIRPLRDIGLWDGMGPTPPCPPTVPGKRLEAVSGLLEQFAAAYDQNPEDDEATLTEAVGIIPVREKAHERVITLFGADNAPALCREGNVLKNLWNRPYPDGCDKGYRAMMARSEE